MAYNLTHDEIVEFWERYVARETAAILARRFGKGVPRLPSSDEPYSWHVADQGIQHVFIRPKRCACDGGPCRGRGPSVRRAPPRAALVAIRVGVLKTAFGPRRPLWFGECSLNL